MTNKTQYTGREKRLQMIQSFVEKNEAEKEYFLQAEIYALDKAYDFAKEGDLYNAYIKCDLAIKAQTARMGGGLVSAILSESFILGAEKQWKKLNELAYEASQRDEKTRLIYENSIKQLEEQRRKNNKEGANFARLQIY